jgi:imidazolonepropionase-like amidohydrolase
MRTLAKLGLGVLAVGAAILATLLVIHLLQLARIRRIAATPADAYVVHREPTLVLDHVRVIDGLGNPPSDDQQIVISEGRLAYVGPRDRAPFPAGTPVVDLSGRTVLPGLVGMHEHLFTTAEGEGSTHLLTEQATLFPLMYLAAGVTTARTAGSIEPERDLEVKQRIDSGAAAGPELFLTAPYLEGRPPIFPEMHALADASAARQLVATWAGRGMTSFKAYVNITADELRAAVDEAHAHGLKITGHLCTLGFNEAADLGIDNLEHGLLVDSEFFSAKRPGECPRFGPLLREYDKQLDVGSAPVQALIRNLVARHVAVTSTLAVFDHELGNGTPADVERIRDALTWRAWRSARARIEWAAQFHLTHLLRKEMEFERAFVHAGGTLLAGADPTGNGSVLAGFADQRELELLVEAGFTPLEAIRIATANGAEFLGIADRVGSIAVGKQADVVVVRGDPSRNISDIRNIEIVFRKGIGYSPQKLMAEIHGVVGRPN